ncbi:MAG: FAD-binding oxidoreductase, partial [Perlucidibaca sp.]
MSLAPETLSRLAAIVGESRVRTDADSLKTWGCDWTKMYVPAPSAIVFPSSVEQVRDVVRLANEAGFAIVPSGGRTGLSAGAVAAGGEVVVSFDYMNKILAFIPEDRAVRIQAGVVTEQLQNYAEEQGLYYPVDFASAGSAQLGGSVAT